LRDAVSFAIASENFLKSIECGFVFVSALWHGMIMPRAGRERSNCFERPTR
jgi:hypothetical protein